MSKRNLRTCVAIFVVAGLATPLVGLAASPTQLSNSPITVSYSDLNISAEAGAKTLYSRLQRASEKACGVESYTTVRSLTVLADAKLCAAESLSAAVENIDSDTLSRIHES